MQIPELKILTSSNKTIFNTQEKYIIPLYQRDYAWTEKEIAQLIEDINDIDDKSNEIYYIGSLIVHKRNNTYEVIDGQQRLTTLYLLLACLGYNLEQSLTFACREKSNYTLENLLLFLNNNDHLTLDEKKIKPEIKEGIDIINKIINNNLFDKQSFINKLKNVVLYRIEVPENTDLNRYFEIMNTRGEQLEAQDIVKADLMSGLNDNEKEAFALLWNACSDMNGYVQMHFNTENRICLFSSDWEMLQFDTWNDYYSAYNKTNHKHKKQKKQIKDISAIIQDSFIFDKGEIIDEDDNRVRFESIIEFSHFLLHCLKSFVSISKIKSKNDSKILFDLIDDKKLSESFSNILNNGLYRGSEINKTNFAKRFIVHLIKSRFYFDKYIIKREFVNENSDGEWSLKELKKSKKNTPYFNNTVFKSHNERNDDKKYNERQNNILMMQSSCRVSYTSPKVMHWITKALSEIHNNPDSLDNFERFFESIISTAVKVDFLDKYDNDIFEMGTDTPHIVFNYLDYLLWKENKKKYKDFIFEFRNSVEHWYPKNPSEDSFNKWENGVNTFGNLCLLQRNINSKFSNLAPTSKLKTYIKSINKGSIKLRIMKEITEEVGDEKWKNEACKDHENEMINKLKEACGIQ
jgi:protein of hypothetical function DUF262